MGSRPLFVAPLLRNPQARYFLCNDRTGSVVATSVETAFDSRTRRRGLLGRDGLPQGSALIIAPCNSIHTFGMRFPIDALFVRRSGEVVKVCPNIPAWRVRLAPRAFAVIELAAGAVKDEAVTRGDCLVLTPETLGRTMPE